MEQLLKDVELERKAVAETEILNFYVDKPLQFFVLSVICNKFCLT